MKIKVTKINENTFEGISLSKERISFYEDGGSVRMCVLNANEKIWGWNTDLPINEEIEVKHISGHSSKGLSETPKGLLVTIQLN